MACNCQNCNGLCPCSIDKMASRYFTAYNFKDLKSLAEAWSAKYPELRSRLLKALAFTGEVVRKGPTLYEIESENQVYKIKVDPTGGGKSTCTCPDFANRGMKCKHILACALVFSAEKGDAPLEPVSYPPQATDRSFSLGGKDYTVVFIPNRNNFGVQVLYAMDEATGVWLNKNELKAFISKYQSEINEGYTDTLLPVEASSTRKADSNLADKVMQGLIDVLVTEIQDSGLRTKDKLIQELRKDSAGVKQQIRKILFRYLHDPAPDANAQLP